jgi:hypothetical protein
MYSVDNSLEELLECKLPEGYLTKISEREKINFATNLFYYQEGIIGLVTLKMRFDIFVNSYGDDFLKANVKDYEAVKRIIYPNIQKNLFDEIRSTSL